MVVLVMGVTGQIGGLLAKNLLRDKSIALRVTSRRREELDSLAKTYGDAVYLDLNDPRTFPEALRGVERLFLLTGYSVDMLVQSKALIDAAVKANVKHIVHLGVFSPHFDCYDAHFAWHQLIEAYIKTSGIPYTFLHPNCFLQNFTGFYGMAKEGKLTFYADSKRVGWIALEDVAEASAVILSEGPAKHRNKDYWFSTESLNIEELAQIFTEVTGKRFTANNCAPDQFLKDYTKRNPGPIDPYFLGVADMFQQVADGRMAYVAEVRDDLPKLIGRRGLTVREWAKLHKAELAALAAPYYVTP